MEALVARSEGEKEGGGGAPGGVKGVMRGEAMGKEVESTDC